MASPSSLAYRAPANKSPGSRLWKRRAEPLHSEGRCHRRTLLLLSLPSEMKGEIPLRLQHLADKPPTPWREAAEITPPARDLPAP